MPRSNAAARPANNKRPVPVFGGNAVRCKQIKLSVAPRPSQETAAAVKVSTAPAALALAPTFDPTPVAVDQDATKEAVCSPPDGKATAEEATAAGHKPLIRSAAAVRRMYFAQLFDALERGIIKFEPTPSSAWPDLAPGHLVVVPGRNAHRASSRYIRNHRHWIKAAGFMFDHDKKLWWRETPAGWHGLAGA